MIIYIRWKNMVSVGYSEIISKSDHIIWENGDGDKEQAMVIHYVDGGESAFYLSDLIRSDYQPAARKGRRRLTE